MEVIPAINCTEYPCVKERLRVADELGAPAVQFDISDGIFTPVVTWNDPEMIMNELEPFAVEVHAMVERPMEVMLPWIGVGASRVIIHVESSDDIASLHRICAERGVSLMLAIAPDTPLSSLEAYLDDITEVQVLAVSPGRSGQAFDSRMLERIRDIKSRYPDVTIEVDGGMNAETVRQVKEAGADSIVSGSYIFEAADPTAAYHNLLQL